MAGLAKALSARTGVCPHCAERLHGRSRVPGFKYCRNTRCAGYGRLDTPYLDPELLAAIAAEDERIELEADCLA